MTDAIENSLPELNDPALSPSEGAEPAPPAEAPAPADQNAEADLARAPRAQNYRVGRRARLSMSLFGLLMVGMGGLLLYDSLTPDRAEFPPALLIVLAVTAAGVGLLARFALNGRRERGLSVIGWALVGWAGLAFLVSTERLEIGVALPAAIAVLGMALLLTFMLERGHDRGVVLPGMAFIVAAIVALPFGIGAFSPALAQSIALFWPVLIIIVAVLLLPRAFRPRDG